jgi:hypothetical protein
VVNARHGLSFLSFARDVAKLICYVEGRSGASIGAGGTGPSPIRQRSEVAKAYAFSLAAICAT